MATINNQLRCINHNYDHGWRHINICKSLIVKCRHVIALNTILRAAWSWQKETTYNSQVGEIRSHSFALYSLPEGDFSPEAHYEPNEVCLVLNTRKSSTASTVGWVEKKATPHENLTKYNAHRRTRALFGSRSRTEGRFMSLCQDTWK